MNPFTVVKRYQNWLKNKFFESSQYQIFQIEIVFSRRFGYHLLTIYLPSLCFVSIAYLTMYFRLNNFQVRAIVSLTSLLVLTTLNNQASSQLPKTSYFKMIDIWMFGAIGVIFSIIVLQTIIDFVYEPSPSSSPSVPKKEFPLKEVWGSVPKTPVKSELTLSQRIMRKCRICIPIIIFVFVVIYILVIITSPSPKII